jgi:hypothetical protein
MVASAQTPDVFARLVRIQNLIDALAQTHGDSSARKIVRDRLSYEVAAAAQNAGTSDPTESDDDQLVEGGPIRH